MPAKIFFAAALLLAIFVSACSGAQGEITPTPGTPGPGVSFQNPVLARDFPDPFVLQVGERFYAYATNAAFLRVQVAVSTNMVEWELLDNAMPTLAKWASSMSGLTWAPEVMAVDGHYLMYYTTRHIRSNKQCIGLAVSDSPEGPFRDSSDQPLVCQVEEGGTIDASPFQDGDRRYLYYKNDGNCCGMPTYIYAQVLAADGMSLVGEPVRLLVNDQPWEAHVIEAPTMWKHDGRYYLFFSANNYAGPEYAVGYALCETPLGPCEDAPENPILKSEMEMTPPVIGPGHQTIITVGGQDWIVYHAWEANEQGQQGGWRNMWIDRLDWVDGKPVVRGPTRVAQPVPEVGQ